jgi:translation initiation factor IF-3
MFLPYVFGEPSGIMKTKDALALAEEKGLDLIEISDKSVPPIAKIMDYGKFQYEQSKKLKEAKSKVHKTETKSIQVKIATGENDLELKAKKASEWLAEGHRVKVELYLVGRSKYTDDDFKKGRLDRVLNLISGDYKVAEPLKRSPRGVMITLEKDTKKK